MKMTLDNDTGHFHPSPPRKSYNPFDSDDDTLDSPSLKSENVYTPEDLKQFQKGADELTVHIDNGDLSWEEAIFGEPAVNASANDHTSLFVQDGQLYTDKNVTDCELPEVEVCYKENNCQSVKDIGIDEGVPIHDKLWVESSEDESKDSSSLLALSGKVSDAVNAEKDFGQVNVPQVKDGVEDSLKLTELKLVEDQASFPVDWATTTVETTPGETDPSSNASKCELDLIGKDGPDHDETEEKKGDESFPDKVDDGVTQELNSGDTLSKVITECEEAKVKPDETPIEENPLPNSSEDVKLEPESTVKSGEPQNTEPEKPPTTQSMTRHEEATSNKSSVAVLELRGLGETSFSSITFTGPVSYSGNISLRSESSAGSTRSFAFPVMQNEWNSSPVRMAKADQRHFKKQRGWVQSLICCRF